MERKETVRYYSFAELTEVFASRQNVALEYAEDDGPVMQITYSQLADMIRAAADYVRSSGQTVRVIKTMHSPACIADIFGSVIAGCDIIMSDEMIPEDVTARIAAAAEQARAARCPAPDAEGELLFFTSGTTSRSKVVRLTSESFTASAWSGQSMLACGEGDKLLSILPLNHVFGFVCSLLWGLAYGACVCLGRGVRHIVDDTLFYRPTIISAVPSLVEAMMRFDTLNEELRVILIGAAPCTKETAAVLRARGIDVYFGYGLTETSSGIAITQDLDDPAKLYPCPGADLREEEDGEISVATPCMMQGYLGMPSVFRDGRFYTGDIGRIDEDGCLRLFGRKKDVLIMADGTKIFCPEYEEDLAKMVGSAELAIINRDGRAVLVAGPEVDEDELRAAVREYNRELMRSQQIYDIVMSSRPLPRTATGKVRRYELQERFK